jgi:hypothetical protein
MECKYCKNKMEHQGQNINDRVRSNQFYCQECNYYDYDIKVFEGLVALKDACKVWHKAESTLKTNIKNGKFEAGIDCFKFGTTWVLKVDALEREYGIIENI